MIDVSVPTGPLADAAARLARLLPARSSAPLSLRADRTGLLVVGTDGELSAQFRVPASTHEAGEVVVSRRGLAHTVAGLGAPAGRVVARGSRRSGRGGGGGAG